VKGEPSQSDLRVLVVAPTGKDAINISVVLRKAEIETVACPNLSAVALEIPKGCGAVLLTEEALSYERYRDLSQAFNAQPKWSTIPVALIVKGGKTPSFREEAVRALGVRSSLSIVERPVRAATLVSTLRSALVSRRQQLEVRDLLKERDELLATLERKVEERTAKLQELNSELEAFSYSVSHDLRAPLRSMESYARILYDEHAHRLSDEGRHFAYRIMKNAEKMDRLMLDVLTISRVSRSELKLVPLDLDEVLQEVIDQYPDLAAAHRLIKIEAPLGQVLADHSSLIQCFSNLLQNALKFVPKDRVPEIRVSSEGNEEMLRVCVRDNGVGIDPQMYTRIFEIFERAGPHDVPGTGIGLAIVKKAVERMTGTVGVTSELGAGANFWIQLPRVIPWRGS
jgi:signal transduction histidine kinase